MKLKKWSALVASIVVLGLMAACTVAAPPAPVQEAETSAEPAEEQAAEEAEPAEEAEAESAAAALPGTSGERFEGQTVVVVSVAGDQGEYLKKIAGDWEEQTGATVELNLIPFGELQDKVATAGSGRRLRGRCLEHSSLYGRRSDG